MRRLLVSFLIVTACSSSDFDAGTPVVSKEQPSGTTKPGDSNSNNPFNSSPDVVGTTPVNTYNNPIITPDSTELINNCSECMARAQQLSALQGFTASKSKTYNLGRYKVDPSKSNICDIHFMADMNIRIDDHAGRDSSGNGQVMIYCPCDCGWSTAIPYY